MFKVSKIKFEGNFREAILKTVEPLGGFGKFIKKGEVVMLKPNFNTADPFPASSDPEFLKVVIELCYEAGAKSVILGESSTYFLNTRQVMEKLKIFDFENLEPAPIIYIFDERNWIKKEIPKAQYLKKVSLPDALERPDKLILLPCLKTHIWAEFTGALKLSVGFIKPSERMALHAGHLQEKIAELNTLIHPDLIIMDGRKCFINKGPSYGEIEEPGLIMASDDRIAIDVEGIKIIQQYENNSLSAVSPWELPQIKLAAELGLGAKSQSHYQILL